jgi:hypothetical protein
MFSKYKITDQGSRSEDYDYYHTSSIPVTVFIPFFLYYRKYAILCKVGAAGYTANHSVNVLNEMLENRMVG